MEWLNNNWLAITAAIGGVVTVASAIASVTPTPKDDEAVAGIKKYLAKFYRVLDMLALNVGRAKERRK